jgi:hypothetical protein
MLHGVRSFVSYCELQNLHDIECEKRMILRIIQE